MEGISVPRFMISGVSSRVGKSILCLGLAVALRKRNISLSSCVIGSDLLQPVFLRRLTRRYTRSLDVRILKNTQILNSVSQAAVGADLLMIEGHKGLYDTNAPGSLKGSDAEIAALTRTPVILVVDACDFGSSLAVLAKGFMDYAKGFSIAGVIANRMDLGEDPQSADRTFLDSIFEAIALEKPIGILPELDTELPANSDIFSQKNSRSSLPFQFFLEIGNLVTKHIDLDLLIGIAKKAPSLKINDASKDPMSRRTKIAVAEDNCFNLCYQDNLEMLKFYGAELVTFSPLADTELPKKIGAVYFPGCALSDYGADLALNEDLKKSIREFAESGGVIYSEGAGTAYLCKRFESHDKGIFYEGVGLIKSDAVQRPADFMYIESILTEESVLGRPGQFMKGIATNEWLLKSDEGMIKTAKTSYDGAAPKYEGYASGAQTFSTFNFIHWGSNPTLAKSLVDASHIVSKIG